MRVRLACRMNFGFFGQRTGRLRIQPDSSPISIVVLMGDMEWINGQFSLSVFIQNLLSISIIGTFFMGFSSSISHTTRVESQPPLTHTRLPQYPLPTSTNSAVLQILTCCCSIRFVHQRVLARYDRISPSSSQHSTSLYFQLYLTLLILSYCGSLICAVTSSTNISYFLRSNRYSMGPEPTNTPISKSVAGDDSSEVRHLLRMSLIDDWDRISHNRTVQSSDDVRNVLGECMHMPMRLSLWAYFRGWVTLFLGEFQGGFGPLQFVIHCWSIEGFINYYKLQFKTYMKQNLIYKLEWTHYKTNNKIKNPDSILSSLPTNLLQLNFWCEIMLLAKSEQTDVPMDAFIELTDQINIATILQYSSNDGHPANSVIFKLKLARHMFQIEVSQSLNRIMEETVITAFAVNSFNHPSAQKLIVTAVMDYIKSQTHFLSQTTLNKISEYLAYKIHPEKQLKNISDIILGTFLVQQLAINSPNNNEQIIKYLTVCKKQTILSYLVEYIIRYDKMNVINLVVEIADKMDRIGVIVKIFGNSPEKFYRMFWLVVKEGKEMQYRYFVNFMVEYSSVRAIVLHQILYPVSHLQETSQSIEKLINQENPQLFTLFRNNPEQTSKKCIEIYLKLSNFHIPKQKIGQSYSDPLAVVGIVRKYWQHQFHGQVINYCIWVLLDGRFCKLTALKCKPDEIVAYRRYLYLALAHIALTYKISTIVNYYPIEYSHLPELLRLDTLPSLLSTVQNLSSILWLPLYPPNNELPLLLRTENGYLLLLKLLQAKIGNHNHTNILHHIEYDIMNLKHKNNKNSKALKSEIKGVLKYFEEKKVAKEQVDKLIKAVQYLD